MLLAAGSAATSHRLGRRGGRGAPQGPQNEADAPDEAAWETLARSTVEGIRIPPLGTPERLAAGGGALLTGQASTGSVLARAESGWDIRSLVADPDPAAANAAAVGGSGERRHVAVVDGGRCRHRAAPVTARAGRRLLEIAPVVLQATGEVTDLQAADAFVELVDSAWGRAGRRYQFRRRPDRPGGSRVARSARTGPRCSPAIRRIGELATGLGVRALVVDGTAAHEAGAGDAAELGYALAVGAEYLRALEAGGCGVEDAFGLAGIPVRRDRRAVHHDREVPGGPRPVAAGGARSAVPSGVRPRSCSMR